MYNDFCIQPTEYTCNAGLFSVFSPEITAQFNDRAYRMPSRKYVINGEACENIKRLKEIENLPDDWNGYGAKRFSKELMKKCRKIVNSLSHQPEIYPTGRQSVQFQYQLEDESYLEFEIFEEKTMCLLVPERIYEKASEKELRGTEEKNIKEIVDNFYGRKSTGK